MSKQKEHVQLFLNFDKKNNIGHYCLIKDFSRLVHSQLTKSKKKIFICERCVTYFYSEDSLLMHENCCCSDTQMRFPTSPNHIMKFKNFKNKLFNQLLIYSDRESILKKCDGAEMKGAYQKHEIRFLSIYLCNRYDKNRSFYTHYYGKDVLHWYFHELRKIAQMAKEVSVFPFSRNFAKFLM